MAKQLKLEFKSPTNGFRRILWANRFFVEVIDGEHMIATFALQAASGILDSARIFLPSGALAAQKDAIVQFLERLGIPESPSAPLLAGSPGGSTIGVADLVGMASGNTHEICFSGFSSFAISQPDRGDQAEVRVDPLLLVRCEPDLMKHFILSIFPQNALAGSKSRRGAH